MGFHAVDVWQFWQGMLRLPCGLRVPEGACANALPAVAENANIKTANNLRTSLDPSMTASCCMPDIKHETELGMNALGAIHCPEWLPRASPRNCRRPARGCWAWPIFPIALRTN